MRKWLVCALLAWLAASASWASRVQADEPAATELYDRVLSEAIQAFKARQWTKARALFERAHEMSPSARTLRGIGVTAFEGGEYVAAIHALEGALVHPQKQLPADLREGTRVLIGQARARVGVIALTVEPEVGAVHCDGSFLPREPDGSLMLDPGVHVLLFSADGFVPSERSLEVLANQSQSLHVVLEPVAPPPPVLSAPPPVLDLSVPASDSATPVLARGSQPLTLPLRSDAAPEAPPLAMGPRGRRIAAYSTLGVGAAGFAAALAMFARGGNLNDKFHDACETQSSVCNDSYIAEQKATISRYERGYGATFALGVGGVFTSATLWTVDWIQHRRARRTAERRAAYQVTGR